MVLDTPQLEYRADDFCVNEYLRYKKIPRQSLSDALDKILHLNQVYRYLASSDSLRSFNTLDPSATKDELSINTKLRLLYETLFGDIILSYVHPTIEERKRRIQATP